MRTRPTTLLFLLLLVVLAPAAAAAQQTGATDADRVRTTIEALFAAAERGDMAALDTLYAGDELTVIEGAGIDRGWAQYRDHHLAPELQEFRNFRYRPSDIEPHVSGDLAWAIFRYSIRADYRDRELDQVGRGTAILERRGDRWVVRHTQTSSRPRRPTDPAAS
jgi:ketosteroid isomerase-like protein